MTRILQNSSKIVEKLRSWLFWSSTGLYVLFTRGSSLANSKAVLHHRRFHMASERPLLFYSLLPFAIEFANSTSFHIFYKSRIRRTNGIAVFGFEQTVWPYPASMHRLQLAEKKRFYHSKLLTFKTTAFNNSSVYNKNHIDRHSIPIKFIFSRDLIFAKPPFIFAVCQLLLYNLHVRK